MAISGHCVWSRFTSALPPKADLFQHRRLCLVLTQSGRIFDQYIKWMFLQNRSRTFPVTPDAPRPVFITTFKSGIGVEGVHRLLQHEKSIVAFLAGEIVELSALRVRAECLHVLFQFFSNAGKLISSFTHALRLFADRERCQRCSAVSMSALTPKAEIELFAVQAGCPLLAMSGSKHGHELESVMRR